MFDSDGISERIFTENLGKVHLPGLPNSPAEYQRARDELLGCSIVSSGKVHGKLFVHGLVQDVARMRLSESHFRSTFMACVQLVSGLWPFQNFTFRHGIRRWPVCEELSPHVMRLRELSVQYGLFPSEGDWDGDFAFAKLLTDVGWYYHERDRSARSRWFNNVAEDICKAWVERMTSESEPSSDIQTRMRGLNTILAEITHNRGCIAVETNQPALAYEYFEEFSVTMRSEFAAMPGLEKSDMRLAISWNELGNAHMLRSQWREGENCFKRATETLRLLDHFEISDLSMSLAGLGLSYWLQQRFPEALETLLGGLRDRQEAFGINDNVSFVTGRFLHGLGNVMASVGRWEQSLDYHRKALSHYKSMLGNGHHRTADLFVKVAEHSMRLKQDDSAL